MQLTNSIPMERRRYARTQLRLNVSGIRLDPDGDDILDVLQVQDISKGGIGVTSSKRYYPGQRIVLTLPVVPGAGRRQVYASVVRCRREQGEYKLGMRFDPATVATCSEVGLAMAA